MAQPSDEVRVCATKHALNRWGKRILGLGPLVEELEEQARRAWQEGRVIEPRRGKARRLWREMIWVFAQSSDVIWLVTVHGPDEPVETQENDEACFSAPALAVVGETPTEEVVGSETST